MKALLLLFSLSLSSFIGAQSLAQKSLDFLSQGEVVSARKTIDSLFTQLIEPSPEDRLNKTNIYFAYYRSALSPERAIDSLKSTVNMYAGLLTGNDVVQSRALENIRMNAALMVNDGVEFFNEGDFQQAYHYFLLSRSFNEVAKDLAPLTMYNIALAAEKLGMNNEAIRWYDRCEALDFKGENCCARAVELLAAIGDKSSREKRIQECLAKYPNSYDLLVAEINYCVSNDLNQRAIPLLQQVLKETPDDYYLHYMLANAYSLTANFEKAAASYSTCLQLSPDFIDGHYNLGTLYFNKGVEIRNQLEGITDPELYVALDKEYKRYMRTALTSLEKAHAELKEVGLMETLMTVYELLGMKGEQEAMRQQLLNQK